MEDEKKELEEKLANVPFEIELDEEVKEEEVEEKPEAKEEEVAASPEKDEEFSKRVQKRISSLVQQRKQAEADADAARTEVSSLRNRIDRLETGSNQKAQEDFQTRYQSA